MRSVPAGGLVVAVSFTTRLLIPDVGGALTMASLLLDGQRIARGVGRLHLVRVAAGRDQSVWVCTPAPLVATTTYEVSGLPSGLRSTLKPVSLFDVSTR